MCCDDECQVQNQWKDDSFFIGLIIVMTVAYVAIAVAFSQTGSPSLKLPPTPGSVVIQDKCRIQVVAASITRVIDFVCSENPITSGRAKLDVNCSSINREFGNPPMHCDQSTNLCAPYCVEHRERFGVTQLFECSWDATKMISNATIVIRPLNDTFNRSYSFNEVAHVIGNVPTHLEHQVDRGMSNRVITSGIVRFAYCIYRVNADGVISDGQISLFPPYADIILESMLVLLVTVLYGICILVTLSLGGYASLKHINVHIMSLFRTYIMIHLHDAGNRRRLIRLSIALAFVSLYALFGFLHVVLVVSTFLIVLFVL